MLTFKACHTYYLRLQMENNNNSDELSKSKVFKKKAKQLNPFHLKVGHEVLRQRKNWWKDGRFQSEWVGPCVIDSLQRAGAPSSEITPGPDSSDPSKCPTSGPM